MHNDLSKVYEKYLRNQLIPYLDEAHSLIIAVYKKSYGTHYVLMRMFEELWIKLDNDYITGAILMDMSKDFDCILHDLPVTKLHAHCLFENITVLCTPI